MKKKFFNYLVLTLLASSQLLFTTTAFAEEAASQENAVTTLAGNDREKNKPAVLAASTDVASWMPDPTLQQVVAKSLNIDVSELTQEKMSRLNTLYIYDTNAALADLTGLEYATNLSSFYMSGTNQVTDFSVLKSLPELTYVYLMGGNVNDDNFPEFDSNTKITRLDLSYANVTDAVYPKIVKLTNLESVSLEYNINITTIAPLAILPHLAMLRIQVCGVTDFTVINQFPSLTYLAAYGQNTGRNDPPTTISADLLNYEKDQQTLYIPFSIMPNRMVNFDGTIPPFSSSNSASQTYLDFNGVQVEPDRLTINGQGITVSNVTPEEFADLQTMTYNSRIDNPAGTYSTPAGYSFYSITSGTYLHNFNVIHSVQGADVTVKYQDENGASLMKDVTLSGNIGDAYASEQKVFTGYTFKEVQGSTTGTFSDLPQTVTYVYQKNPVSSGKITVKYQDESGNSLVADAILSGNIGETYTSQQKAITGYTFKEVQGTPTGTFDAVDHTIVYVYTKNIKPNQAQVIPEKTSKDTGATTTNTPLSAAQIKEPVEPSTNSKKKSAKEMPQTGENNRSALQLSFIGGLLLIVTLGGYLISLKKNKSTKKM
jgi:hypothetical protein